MPSPVDSTARRRVIAPACVALCFALFSAPACGRELARQAAVPESGELSVELRVTLDAAPSAAPGLDTNSAYVALRDGRLVAVDLESGRVRWSQELPTSFAPETGDGLVFVAGGDHLTAVTADGKSAWRLPVAGGFSAPLRWDAGWLIASAASGDVLAIRARDGLVVWTMRLGSPVRARPALAAERVYLSLEDGRVAALNLLTGATEWERTLGGTPGEVLALDERLYVGSRDKFFYCLATDDGDRKWRWRTGGSVLAAPVVDAERVYYTSLDNVLRAMNRSNGWLAWDVGLPLRPSGGPLLVGRLLFVAGVAAEVRAYRTGDGAEAGAFTAPAELAAPPQVLPGTSDLLAAVVLLTRTGDLQVLRRRVEPAIVPLGTIPGIEVPLEPPPVDIEPIVAPIP